MRGLAIGVFFLKDLPNFFSPTHLLPSAFCNTSLALCICTLPSGFQALRPWIGSLCSSAISDCLELDSGIPINRILDFSDRSLFGISQSTSFLGQSASELQCLPHQTNYSHQDNLFIILIPHSSSRNNFITDINSLLLKSE